LAKSTSDSPSLAPTRKIDGPKIDGPKIDGPKIDGPTTPETHLELNFDDNRAVSALVGQYGQHLALLERRLNVLADSRGNLITVAGSRDGCEAARRVLEALYARAERGDDLTQGDVDGAIRAVIAQGSLFDFDPKTARS